MVLAIDWPRPRETAEKISHRWRLPTISRPAKALRAILAKKDDRLLVDAGLTREDALGPAKHFWQEWSHIREPWTL